MNRGTRRGAALLMAAALMFFAVQAEAATRFAGEEEEEDKWKLMREGNGIRVYARKMPETNVRQIRAVMEVAAEVEDLLALVKDSESAAEWIAQVESFETVETVGPDEWYTYAEIAVPWPFKDRDMVSRNRVTREGDAVRVDIASRPSRLPEREDKTRMGSAEGAWVFVPKESGLTEVTYIFYSEPEIDILPQWLVAMLVSGGVHDTLERMRERVE